MTDLEIMCHMRQYANSATNTHTHILRGHHWDKDKDVFSDR